MQGLPNPAKALIVLVFTAFTLPAIAQGTKPAIPAGWRLLSNIEMVEFCLPLPLNEYAAPVSTQKAVYDLRQKSNKKFHLQLQGLLRSDTTASIENYFANSYTEDDEAAGKIVQQKGLLKNTHCFYALGYMSNQIYNERFLEITWLRKDDLVKLTVNFPVGDSKRWKEYLKKLVSFDSFCH